MQTKSLQQLRRVLCITLLFLLLCAVGMMKGYAVTIDDLTYSLNNNNLTATVTGHVDGTAAMGTLTIPGIVSYEGSTYSVTAIGEYAFYYCSGLTGELTIPNSVTTINDYAFYGCSGFTGDLTIPNSVASIGDCAFHYCSGFTEVHFNATNCSDANGSYRPFAGLGSCTLIIGDNVERIPANMFYTCSFFTGGLTIPNSVTSIGSMAFYKCSGFTGGLSIPNSVTEIGGSAFYNCSGFTGTLTIGNSVTTIGGSAFYGCGFTGVYYNAINCADASSSGIVGALPFYGCGGFLVIGDMVERIPSNMFKNGNGFTGSLTIPNSVTSIGGSAFYNCSGFTGSLTISNSVTEIGDSAFSGCSGFSGGLIIGNSVTSIGYSAFKGCNGFTEVSFNATNCIDVSSNYYSNDRFPFYGCGGSLTIGNEVERIPANMFRGGGFTGSLIIPDSVTSIGAAAFLDCSGFMEVNYNATNCADVNSSSIPFQGCGGSLIIGNEVERIPANIFYGCNDFTGGLTIPNSVTSIGDNAFSGCSGFTGSLTIPNSVTVIGSSAFSGCSGFTGSLTIPNSVTVIGSSTFSGCSGFTGSLTIPNSVTEIGGSAFSGCSGFTGSLTIPNSVTVIGSSAFSGCSGFTGSLAIPNSVTVIGSSAFSGCSGFSEVMYNATNCTCYNASNPPFQGCGGILVIGDGVETIPANMFIGGGFTGNLIIPSFVTSIGDYAFSGCSSLAEVVFNATNCTDANSLYPPFQGCGGTLIIGGGVERIPANMFREGSFIGLTISDSVTVIGNYAFYNCSSFTGALTIPNSMTLIGNSAFYGCSGFSEVNFNATNCANANYTYPPFRNCGGMLHIGDNVVRIPNYMFSSAAFIGSVTIPNSVTSIGAGAFRSCSGFEEVVFDVTNCADANSSSGVFQGCGGSLVIGENVEYIPAYMFTSGSFTGSLTIPASVVSIGNYAFYNCGGFTGSLTIPASVTSIGNRAFYYCSNFTEVYYNATNCTDISYSSDSNSPFKECGGSLIIGNNVERIPANMFYKGGFSGSLTFGNSVTEIGVNAFYNCNFTGSLTIPNSMTLIGYAAFSGCNSFTGNLTLGNSSPIIGNYAFYGCSGFTSITSLAETPPTLYEYSFYNVNHSIPVAVPCGSLGAYQNVSYWNQFTNIVQQNCPSYEISTIASPEEGGVVTGAGIYETGEICTLTATPSQGYEFCYWTENDTIVFYSPSYTFTVTNDRNLVANFGDCSDVVIGYGGTTTNQYLPSYSYYNYSLSQQIYTADEIGKSGEIVSLAFYNSGATKTRDYDIYLVSTDKASFAGATDWIAATADDLVYSGSVTMEANTWTTVNFETPFTYDANTNLALIVDDNSGNWTGSPHMACRVFDTDDNQAIRIYSDGTNYDPYNPTQYSGTRYLVKNQIILGFLGQSQRFIFASTNPIEAGTITGVGAYQLGDLCSLTATANIFYQFVNWTKDGVVVSENPTISFTVTENASYVANFNAININHDENNIVYVKPNGCGLNDGSSWDNAIDNLNLAIQYSGLQADKPSVWVSAGNYYGDGIAEHNAFTMVDGVNVYGGFAGNEPADYDLSLRDFETNETILDGQNVQRVLYQANSFTQNTKWDGFTIKNGYAQEESITCYGAGAYIKGNTTINNCIITNNNAFSNSRQVAGGGIYAYGANNTILNSVISNNSAHSNSTAVYGGGLYAYGNADNKTTIHNCVVSGNELHSVAGVGISGSGLYSNYACVTDCMITGNAATGSCSSAFCSYYSDVWYCEINNNTGSYAGLFCGYSMVSNCLIRNNNSSLYGGVRSSNSHIDNCDILNNTGTVYYSAGISSWDSDTIRNCIVWGNEGGVSINCPNQTSEISFCAIEGGYEGTGNINLASDNDGTGNLNYVRFIDPTNNNYQLLENSVCVDAGDPEYSSSDSLDLAGNPRIYNGRIDIGCFEFNNSIIETNLSDEICQGEDYLQNGFEIFQPEVGENEYSITLPSSQGLDSIVNLTLTVHPTYYYTEDTTLCNASSFTWRGHTYIESGFYYDSLQTIHGCDSIYALSLEFFNTPLGEFASMTPTNNYPFTSLPIIFSWDAVSGAEYYNFYLWNVNEPDPSTPYASNIYNRSCYVPSLQNHQNYNWYVEAVNTCFSTTSSVRSFSLNIPPTMNVSAGNLNFGEVALNNSNTLNLYVSGNALDDDITLQITGEDASMFSYVQGSNWNGLTGGSLSVIFMPTTVKYNYNANLVITTGTLTQTVQLTGSLADMFVFNTFVTQDVFEMNSTVPIYGTVMDASNNPAASAEVEVKVTVMNMTRSLFATTGADGHFSVDFVPVNSESGYYTINSGRIGHNSTAVHDDFNIPGLNLVTNGWILWDVVQNETSTGSIVIRNRSQIPLNNIQVTASTLPEGCSFTFQPLSLAGMEEGVLEYSVSGTTPTNGYQEVALVATSSEGASMNFTVWYRCAEPRGILYALPNNITTTMTKGINKIVDVMLYNNGTGPTGSVYLDLPSVEWLSVVGNDTLPSIAVHDSAYFSLRLSANENTPLVQYTGNLAVNCERGDGLLLPYTIMAVSDSTGTLIVDVTDDYTYNGNGQHLAGATVSVKGYYSLETVAIGLTDSNGLFTVNDIPEGYYRMSITAPHHAEYQATIQIEGGQTNTQNIYLQYQAITYSWIVVPTEIQDEYTFELIMEYETNVPVPVVVIDMPQTFPELAEGESFVFEYIITNYGLVDTYDATLYPPTNHPLYDFTPLITEIDTLHAQTSVVIPCTMTVRTGQRSQAVIEALGESIDRDGDCPDRALTEVQGYYYCNGEKKPCTYYCWRNIGSHPCNTPPSSSGGGGGGGSSPGGSGSGGGGVHFGGSGGSSTPPVTTQQQGCNDDLTLPNALDELNSCPPQFDTTPKLPPVQPGNRGNN